VSCNIRLSIRGRIGTMASTEKRGVQRENPFRIWGSNVTQSLPFQGSQSRRLDQQPTITSFFSSFYPRSLHVLLLLLNTHAEFRTVYSLWWRITPAYECNICRFRDCCQEIPPPSIFLFPVSQILLLHTDLYLNDVSPSMKLISLSIHSHSSLSYVRSKTSSKSSSPHSAI